MATVTSTLRMYDAMTGPLKRVTQSMNILISTMYQMQNATNRNVQIDKSLSVAKQQIATAEAEIKQAIEQSEAAQQGFNRQVHEGTTRVNGLLSGLKSMAAAYLSVQSAQAVMRITDEYINTQSRLNMINDGLQTTYQLQNKIFAAANRSRGSYEAMASAVGRLGLLARGVFKNNDEMIAFTELMQKAFKISGASTMEQEAAMYQLTQAMASGRLQGDEFRSIMENAPLLADAIAKYTGKSKGALREMSQEGTITAGIIKGAIFAAADEINGKFETMPKTFGDVFNLIKNNALQAFGPVLERINQFLNSSTGVNLMNNISQAIFIAAAATEQLLTGLSYVFNLISAHWPEIEAMLIAIGTVYLVTIIKQLAIIVAEWLAINRPILATAAAIGVLILVLRELGVTTEQVVGFIGGVFYTLFAFFQNLIAVAWNNILAYAEFLANVFIDPVYAIKKLFYDLCRNVSEFFTNLFNGIISGLNWIIQMVNKVAGTSFSTIDKLSNDWVEKLKPTTNKNVIDLSKYRMAQMDLATAYSQGYKWASGSFNNLAKAISGIGKLPSLQSPSIGGIKIPGDIGKVGKVDEVGKINDTVDISSEDLKVMRELAEMKSIQNFVTLTPTVTVNTGPVNKEADIDTIIRRIEESLERDIAIAAQGVYG